MCTRQRLLPEWEAWTIAMEDSVLTASTGVQQMGLFAARLFSRREVVWHFDGSEVGRFRDGSVAMRRAVARLLTTGAHSYLFALPCGPAGSAYVRLYDGTTG